MVLSDGTIRELIEEGYIGVHPFSPSMVQPSSIDVRIGQDFRVFHNSRHRCIDVREDMSDLTELVTKEYDEPFILHPGEFILGTTFERVEIPNRIVARLEGKSSLGRLGLVIHSTAGFIDPGFKGHITLELSNANNLPITLYPLMPIGQIAFQRMDRDVESPYGSPERQSKYQNQSEPAPSQMHRNFEQPLSDTTAELHIEDSSGWTPDTEEVKEHEAVEIGGLPPAEPPTIEIQIPPLPRP